MRSKHVVSKGDDRCRFASITHVVVQNLGKESVVPAEPVELGDDQPRPRTECPWSEGTAGFATWGQAQALRAALEQQIMDAVLRNAKVQE